MAKNLNEPTNTEEEFHYTEENIDTDTDSDRYDPASVSKSSGAVLDVQDEKARRRKSLMILIGLMVGIFCLYKLYGQFTSSSGSSVAKKQSSPAKTAVIKPLNISTAAKMPQKSQHNFENNSGNNTMADMQLAAKVSSLEKALTQSGQTQDNLQNQIAGLSTAISDIQNNLSLLSRQMSDYAAQNQRASNAKTASNSQKLIKKTSKSQKKHVVVAKSSNPSIFYSLNALIHGRAWLTSSGGNMLTVSEGDELAGYGKIQAIDPENARVSTSSGRIIRFAPDDR